MGKGCKNSDPSFLPDDQEQQPSTATSTTSTSTTMTNESIALANRSEKRQFTWKEIRQHSTKKDRWLVIDGRVYDVTRWTKHPGGQAVLNHYAGQDASVR